MLTETTDGTKIPENMGKQDKQQDLTDWTDKIKQIGLILFNPVPTDGGYPPL